MVLKANLLEFTKSAFSWLVVQILGFLRNEQVATNSIRTSTILDDFGSSVHWEIDQVAKDQVAVPLVQSCLNCQNQYLIC